MTQTVFIPIRYPGLNEVLRILKGKGGKYRYTQLKNKLKQDTALFVGRLKPMETVRVRFVWVEPNRRRDADNIMYAQKFILDTLKDVGVIRDDRRKYVVELVHSVPDDMIDKETPGVHLILEEVDGKGTER